MKALAAVVLTGCRALPPVPVLTVAPSTAPEVRALPLYLVGSFGSAAPLGDTGNALSLDFGVARPMRHQKTFFSLPLADTQR